MTPIDSGFRCVDRVYNECMSDFIPDDAIRVVEHTADWALRVRGRDLTELFRYAAAGVARLLVGEQLDEVPLDTRRQLKLEAYDAEGLLVDWLGELTYWAERDGLVFPVVERLEVTPNALVGAVCGGRAPELQKHIKAVTYHDLAIREVGGALEVTIVFDV